MAPKFGTSGLRGLVTELTDALCARYARAFLAAMPAGDTLFVGRDLRPSSPRIATAVAGAAGRRVVDCGAVPTPALALAAMAAAAPSIMVTGSHIPADRNGLKFYSPTGEITKKEEGAITALADDASGAIGAAQTEPYDAAGPYARRYIDFFGPGALGGLQIGVYQHSSVARDLLVEVARGLGAEVVPFLRADNFIPVDTEAVDAEVREMLRAEVAARGLDAVISCDGDADRPLVADQMGDVVPGDILGCLTAIALGADSVVTPVSSNTMVERSSAFARVLRTRIGSPYVIAGIEELARDGGRPVGFEANGGFLLGFDALRDGRRLTALMTRDAFLPMFAALALARERGQTLRDLVASLPPRRTAADRLENAPTEQSLALVAALAASAEARAAFFAGFGPERTLDQTDGLRVTFADGLVLHLRPSGNAPELRAYAEADNAERAEAAMREVLARARARLS